MLKGGLGGTFFTQQVFADNFLVTRKAFRKAKIPLGLNPTKTPTKRIPKSSLMLYIRKERS